MQNRSPITRGQRIDLTAPPLLLASGTRREPLPPTSRRACALSYRETPGRVQRIPWRSAMIPPRLRKRQRYAVRSPTRAQDGLLRPGWRLSLDSKKPVLLTRVAWLFPDVRFVSSPSGDRALANYGRSGPHYPARHQARASPPRHLPRGSAFMRISRMEHTSPNKRQVAPKLYYLFVQRCQENQQAGLKISVTRSIFPLKWIEREP